MARTKRNAMNIAEAREKIRTTQLVKRLTGHALGDVEMSSTQVTAALGLLKKSLPDLAAHAHTGEGFQGPVLIVTGVDRADQN